MLAAILGALRATVEMLGLCLLGQAALALIAGHRRAANPVYRFFSLLTMPPRRLVRACLPRRVSDTAVAFLAFCLLLLLWVSLAAVRKML